MDALADLEELQEALSGFTAVKADDNAQLANMAAKFFKGLSVIHLVCNTGQGIPLSLPLLNVTLLLDCQPLPWLILLQDEFHCHHYLQSVLCSSTSSM